MSERNKMLQIIVRPVVLEDLKEVYNLICDLEGEKMNVSLFKEIFVDNLKDSNVYYLVAVAEGNIVGFISLHVQHILHHSQPTGEIQELIISSKYQGRGVGTLLMQNVETLARGLALEEIELTTRVFRERAQIFYKQLGYTYTHNKFVKKIIS